MLQPHQGPDNSEKEDSKIDTNRQKTGGRQQGTPNKATAKVRHAIAEIVEGNVGKVQEWIDELAEQDVEKAANLLIKLMEFTTPKLARSELSGTIETTTRLIINE